MNRSAAAFLLTAALLSGCSSEPADEVSADRADAWRLAAAPADAMSVLEAKAAATPGEPITLTGKIGGRLDPITPASGLFVLMDTSLPSCDELPGDTCPTPWDYCCEASGDVARHAATIQLRDSAGDPIALAADDLSPLDRVTVVGTVAPAASDSTLIVHATGVAVP
jgi:hypothetical protein